MKRTSRRNFLYNTSLVFGGSILLPSFAQCQLSPSGNRKLGIALVGLGSYSTHQLAPALQETEHCHLAGVVTGTPSKEQTWADKYNIPTKTLSDRVRHVVQSAFNGKRIVIFSGGEAKDTPALLDEIRELAKGGGFGSIMGRNAFQRPRAEAVKLLQDVQDIFRKGG